MPVVVRHLNETADYAAIRREKAVNTCASRAWSAPCRGQ